MPRVWMLALFLVVIAGVLGLEPSLRPVDRSSPPVGARAEQLWAQGLLRSVALDETPRADAVRVPFVAALQHARHRAPIFLSLAIADHGLLRLREQFRGAMEATEKELNQSVEKHLREEFPEFKTIDPRTVTLSLQAAIDNAYRGLPRSREFQGRLESLFAAVSGTDDEALQLYGAAAADDPAYLPAWFRLATHGDGAVQQRAVDELIRRDPTNAFPWYLRPSLMADSGDLAAALQCVETGNQKTVCVWYPPEMPAHFRLRFPDSETTRSLGIAREPVTPAGLGYLRRSFEEAFSWADPLNGQLRVVAQKLGDEAEQRHAKGSQVEAGRHLQAVHQMAVHLIHIRPRNTSLMVVGATCLHSGRITLFEKVATLQKDARLLASLKKFRPARKAFLDEILHMLEAINPKKRDLRAILLGQDDLLAQESKLLDQAVHSFDTRLAGARR